MEMKKGLGIGREVGGKNGIREIRSFLLILLS